MPFSAQCNRCGYVVMANKRKTLNLLMDAHDSDSHKVVQSDFSTWKIAVITNIDYHMLLQASKVSAFWNALNTRLK